MIDYAAAREAMVDRQVRTADVTRYPIIAAMLAVPREDFVPGGAAPGRLPRRARAAGARAGCCSTRGSSPSSSTRWPSGRATSSSTSAAASATRPRCSPGWPRRWSALESDPAMAAEAEALLAAHGVDNAVVQAGPLADGVADARALRRDHRRGRRSRCCRRRSTAQLKPGGRIAAIFVEGSRGQARLGLRTGDGIAWRRIFDATAPVLPGFAATKAFEF